jgi:hypothetical protein
MTAIRKALGARLSFFAAFVAAFFTASVAALILAFATAAAPLAARAADGLPVSASGLLVEETLSQSPDPHAYDWRKIPFQAELGYGSVEEGNSFKSRFYSLGVASSIAPSWLARATVRSVETSSTGSSDALAHTPYSQAAQPSRYEILLGGGYALLEGRSATPLSPRMTDLGHALYVIGGLQYNYFPSRDPEPVPAMRAIYYDYCAEAGLRFQAYLPRAIGLSLEWTYSVPLTKADGDLPNWQRFAGNISWSFGN